MATEPPPTADEAVGELSRVIARLASRGMPADRAVAVLLCLAARVAKWGRVDGHEAEFVDAARRYYREIGARDGK